MTDPRNELKPGQIQWHTSDEEGGTPDVGMFLQIDADNSLWIGEITRRRWEEAGSDAAELGSDMGWWIIHYTKTDSTVLGKCVSSWPELSTDFLDSIAAAIARTADGPEPVAWQWRSTASKHWVTDPTLDGATWWLATHGGGDVRPLYLHPVPVDGPETVALTYGQKLIAEAIEAHFGERIVEYDEDVDDTSNHDAWEAFDAITHPVPVDGPAPAVSEAEVDAALGAWRAAPGLGVNKAIIRICLEAAQRARP